MVPRVSKRDEIDHYATENKLETELGQSPATFKVALDLRGLLDTIVPQLLRFYELMPVGQ